MAYHLLVVLVSSAKGNVDRRRSLRRSWFTFKTSSNPWLTPDQQQRIEIRFVVSGGSEELDAEQKQYGDLLLLDAPEGYHNLWRKALVSLEVLEQQYQYAYYMHADDDSYVRLDLITQLLETSPRGRFYWGYVWDGRGNRVTAPIRNPCNKSHMPVEQYSLDYYPPFASGCGFVLSRDLVQALLKQPLPDYRLLDPPFGIHLCGSDFCVLPDGPIQPVHSERVHPYRGIPIFKPTTIVQHYLRPEEMLPFHKQVLEALEQQCGGSQQAVKGAAEPAAADGEGTAAGAGSSQQQEGSSDSAPDKLYAQLVSLGLLRR